MATIEELAAATQRGDAEARAALFAALYDELHRLARRELYKSGGALTLGATTLLHEAYLSVAGAGGAGFPDKARFMAYAARAMRNLVIDHVRRRQAGKRGGGLDFTELDTTIAEQVGDAAPLEAIGDALDALAQVEPQLAELVDLKFFCGLGFEEIAALRGVSARTVQRDWEKARLWLEHSLGS
ncbi:ECF-type sigma factor [Piscinibacter sp.]|uniref:ECF-type sigma factor n=1 Tax=Piscinibacter sp. TaxID=1903157 RepID=UPI0039E359BB